MNQRDYYLQQSCLCFPGRFPGGLFFLKTNQQLFSFHHTFIALFHRATKQVLKFLQPRICLSVKLFYTHTTHTVMIHSRHFANHCFLNHNNNLEVSWLEINCWACEWYSVKTLSLASPGLMCFLLIKHHWETAKWGSCASSESCRLLYLFPGLRTAL